MMDMMLGKQAIKYNAATQMEAIKDNLADQIEMNNTYAQNASWEYAHGAEASRQAGNINALTDLTAGIGTYASIEAKTPTGWWGSKPDVKPKSVIPDLSSEDASTFSLG